MNKWFNIFIKVNFNSTSKFYLMKIRKSIIINKKQFNQNKIYTLYQIKINISKYIKVNIYKTERINDNAKFWYYR